MTVEAPFLKLQSQKTYKKLLSIIFQKLYKDTNRDIGKSIFIAGSARSGTTWLAETISSQLPSRIIFEPFHTEKVAEFRKFNYFQYMRPMDRNDELRDYCQKVFSGQIRSPWIDKHILKLRPKYRLVKEIRANLFLKWIHNSFSEIPILFVIRHPCAVVLSRMQLGWATDADLESFLTQKNLVNDFLAHKMDIIRRANSPEEKHAIIWCISNLIPIEQFNCDDLTIVFYENLCLYPKIEIPRIFGAIRHEQKVSVYNYAKRASVTATPKSPVVTGANKVSQWKNVLSSIQVKNILRIVEIFGLDYIYNESPTPLVVTSP
jgi:hypothetical protein